MPFENKEVLFLALIFLVPGFIIRSVICEFTTRKSFDVSQNWMSFLILSLVNDAVWYPIIHALQTWDYLKNSPILSAFLCFYVLVIGPLLIGLIIAFNHNKDWSHKLFLKFGFNPIHIIPSAWDWRFSKSRNVAQWIIVTLKDDSTVAGYFSDKSFASSDREERDIYIEQVYIINSNGVWEKENDKGILILGNDIKYIEFQPDAGV